jgi:hypothetical protein
MRRGDKTKLPYEIKKGINSGNMSHYLVRKINIPYNSQNKEKIILQVIFVQQRSTQKIFVHKIDEKMILNKRSYLQ